MSEDDFTMAWEDDDFVDEIARAAVYTFLAYIQPLGDAPGSYVMGTAEEAERSYRRRLSMQSRPVVSTVEELDKLPVGSVVIDPYAATCTRLNDTDFWAGWKRVTSAVAGGAHNHRPYLPARVLYIPEGGEDA